MGKTSLFFSQQLNKTVFKPNEKSGILSFIIRSSFLIDERGRLLGAGYKVRPEDTVSNALVVLGQ